MNKRKDACRLLLSDPRTRSVLSDDRVRLSLPDEVGDCFNDFIELEQGLGLGRLHYCPSVPLIEETNGPHNGRVMVITLGMQGSSCYEGQDATRLDFKKGHTTISSFNSMAGERRYSEGTTVSQLRLIVHEKLICKYVGHERTERILGGDTLNCLAFRANTPATETHANALFSQLLPLRNQMPRLGVHIHTLSLLSEQFNLLAPEKNNTSSIFPSQDIERIEQARQLMNDALDQPLTLHYLAAMVGTNKNKLKEGMIYLYNKTPTELLLELRMNKALALLSSGQQVSQVAWQVGYKYANNFTVAFSRYYGKSPKTMFGK